MRQKSYSNGRLRKKPEYVMNILEIWENTPNYEQNVLLLP